MANDINLWFYAPQRFRLWILKPIHKIFPPRGAAQKTLRWGERGERGRRRRGASCCDVESEDMFFTTLLGCPVGS